VTERGRKGKAPKTSRRWSTSNPTKRVMLACGAGLIPIAALEGLMAAAAPKRRTAPTETGERSLVPDLLKSRSINGPNEEGIVKRTRAVPGSAWHAARLPMPAKARVLAALANLARPFA
jgi:hypothetical protein